MTDSDFQLSAAVFKGFSERLCVLAHQVHTENISRTAVWAERSQNKNIVLLTNNTTPGDIKDRKTWAHPPYKSLSCLHEDSCLNSTWSSPRTKVSSDSYRCLFSSCRPCPCMTICPEECFPSLGESMWGMSTSSKPKSKRLCLELSGRKKKAPKHKVMKALRIRRRMNFSESLNVALWCGKEEAPGDSVGILRPDSGSRVGVVIVPPMKGT